MPFFKDFYLETSGISNQYIELRWQENNVDTIYSGSTFSDGSIRLICLITLLFQPKPPQIIILDEPEIGLHPKAISIIAALIRKASHYSQMIVATQSTLLIDEFDAKDIVVVDKTEEGSIFKRLDSENLNH